MMFDQPFLLVPRPKLASHVWPVSEPVILVPDEMASDLFKGFQKAGFVGELLQGAFRVGDSMQEGLDDQLISVIDVSKVANLDDLRKWLRLWLVFVATKDEPDDESEV